MFRLAESEQLDRTALTCAAATALCVATSFVVPGGAVGWLRWMGPLFLTVAGSRGSWKPRTQSAIFGGAAVIAYGAFAGYPVFAEVVAGALVGLGLTQSLVMRRSAESPTPRSKLLQLASVSASALAWPLALRAMDSVQGTSLGQGVIPPVIVQSAAGGLFGLLMGMTTAPVYLEPLGDRVAEALQRVRPSLDGELRSLVLRIVEARARALKLLEKSRAEGDARLETRRGLDGLALTAIELTDRFASVDRVLSRTPLKGIEERSAAMRAKLADATDPGVKRDLDRALTSLEEQRVQVERLLQGRSRLMARLESELAALEKTEMSLALLASGDAAMSGLRLESIGSGLGQQAQELEAEGSALQEALTVAPHQILRKIAE